MKNSDLAFSSNKGIHNFERVSLDFFSLQNKIYIEKSHEIGTRVLYRISQYKVKLSLQNRAKPLKKSFTGDFLLSLFNFVETIIHYFCFENSINKWGCSFITRDFTVKSHITK